ncbi:Nanos-type domain-containing protein [Aphelenchoides besseyi]|nr:Nanos-type domain-containing protein [Aphelenchoides besseyi]KAI6235900.1 Nanos-type domain-containing protein [Aphelenchoides besseyi]
MAQQCRRNQPCGYCASLGHEAQSHNRYCCPKLAALKPCSICGASGYNNHTRTHCPQRPKLIMELIPERMQPTPWKGKPIPYVALPGDNEQLPHERMWTRNPFESFCSYGDKFKQYAPRT